MKLRNKHKSCEIDQGSEEVDDDKIIEGRRKKKCRNGFIRYL